MSVSIYSFTPNTTIESAKVNSNFTNLKTEVDDLRDEKTMVTATDSSTVTFNLATSHYHSLTMTDVVGVSRTLQVTNAVVGESFVVRLVQSSSGSRTVSWNFGTIKWPGGSAPTLSTGANKIDTFGFTCTATGIFDGLFLGFDLS